MKQYDGNDDNTEAKEAVDGNADKEKDTSVADGNADTGSEEVTKTTLPERMRKLREYLGLSQAQFAYKIGKTPGMISLVETGRSGLSEESLNDISREFGVNKQWLQTGSGGMFIDGQRIAEADKKGIGNRVKGLRSQLGLTQEQFAKGIPCSKDQISKVEKGDVIPTVRFLQRLADAYYVNFAWLLTGVEEKRPESVGVEADRIRDYMFMDSVAREVVLEAMKKDRTIWLKFYKVLNEKGD